MAHLAKHIYLPLKGVELLWNSTMYIQPLKVCGGIIFPKVLFCSKTNENNEFKLKMWKTIKKNDPEMDYFLNSARIQERIKDLAGIMCCSIERATELVRRDCKIGIKDQRRLFNTIKLLFSYGFTAENIISNPSVLHRTHKVLQQRLELLNEFSRPPNQRSMYVLAKTNFQFKMYLKYCAEEDEMLSRFSSTQDCIASLLNCDAEEAKELIVKYNCESISMVLLKNKIDVFSHYQIPSNIIRKNFYLLVYLSSEVIENRLQLLSDHALLKPPYVGITYLGTKKDKFEKSVDFLIDKKNALEGCKDKADYLTFRLNCSKTVAEGLLNNTVINNISEIKLKKMLDLFLDEMQVSSSFVIGNAYLMKYSYERSQNRWNVILTTQFNTPRWISRLLAMSDDSFQKFIKNLKCE